MTREVEPLQPLEQRGAQVVLHVERVAATDESPDVREDELHRGRTDEQREQGRGGDGVVDDEVVDDRPLDQRGDRRDRRCAERDAERDERLALVRDQEGPELAEPAPLGHARAGATTASTARAAAADAARPPAS